MLTADLLEATEFDDLPAGWEDYDDELDANNCFLRIVFTVF